MELHWLISLLDYLNEMWVLSKYIAGFGATYEIIPDRYRKDQNFCKEEHVNFWKNMKSRDKIWGNKLDFTDVIQRRESAWDMEKSLALAYGVMNC